LSIWWLFATLKAVQAPPNPNFIAMKKFHAVGKTKAKYYAKKVKRKALTGIAD
jgi:hypothetical protein